MKQIYIYILFIVLIVYHLLLRTWWTPALYYTGTYGILILLLYDKYKLTENINFILLTVYFGLIYLYLITSINKDIQEFYSRLSIRKYALGFAGIAIFLFMFFKHEKRKII